MTNAELIKNARTIADSIHVHSMYQTWEYERIKTAEKDTLEKCADALEAAEHRIEDLEGALAACRARKDGRLPKDGEWIWNSDTGTYHCSECNATSPREDQDGEYIDCPNYCQNCGSRMQNVTDCHTLEEENDE